MLITQLKDKEMINSLVAGKKVFIINCHGCKEVHFPEKEAVELHVPRAVSTDSAAVPKTACARLIIPWNVDGNVSTDGWKLSDVWTY